MKSKVRLYLTVACLIVLFDLAGSLASRVLHFDYGSLTVGSLFLYGVSGYMAFRYHRIVGGLLAGLMAGFCDSTVGWALSTAIHPYMRYPAPRLTVFVVSVTVVFVTLVGGFFGFTGAVIAKGITLLQEGEPGQTPSSP
ncbi:MAG: hypothetical protein ACM3SW_10475 [Actinomycetota bacterium]